METSSKKGEIGNNIDALIKEYEIRFNYAIGLTSRFITLVSAHIVFVSACVVAFFSKDSTDILKYILSGFNLLLCIMEAWWTIVLSRRHRMTIDRIDRIGSILGIPGYYCTPYKKKSAASLSVFGIVWLCCNLILWLFLLWFSSN